MSHLEDGGHARLHAAGLVDAGLGLEIAGGLELQAFVGAWRDAGAAVEGLFETSTKPVQEMMWLVSVLMCSVNITVLFLGRKKTLLRITQYKSDLFPLLCNLANNFSVWLFAFQKHTHKDLLKRS